ncbi:O-antigen ligase family protein [Flavobacteriaceae bacterium]|nr:O-antigen ligase family protein [Flavobacteriaceae bacterium]
MVIFLIAIPQIIFKKNKNEEAFLFAAYLAAGEVFLRMTDGVILYETGKYGVILLLVLGVFVGKFKQKFSVSLTFYLLLLLLGIIFTRVPEGEYIRKTIAFNLSGPFVLGITGLYFYKRSITKENLMNALFFMILPLFSMVTYLYFKTPDLKDIVFGGAANFATSGGFGPNQVATAIGLGIFIIAVFILMKERITGFLLLDVFLLLYFIYRGLLTFSRGGLITGVIALICFSLFYTLYKKISLASFITYVGIVVVFTIGIWLFTSNITGGMLDNRYTGKNASGVQKEDISSGRGDILAEQITSFTENPLGIGVGNGKYKRQGAIGNVTAASHNEVGRLIEEHGIIGFIILLLLLLLPLANFWYGNNYQRAFISAFYIFWFLTINHSAMRIAFPGFIYGLSLINIIHEKE